METRYREIIEAYVKENPGTSTRTVARAVGVDDSTADYHLRRMQKEGLLQCHGRPRQVTWWHRDGGPWCPVLTAAIPAFRRDGVLAVARALDDFPVTTGELVERSGLPMGQVRWNVEVLGGLGLLEKSRTGRAALAEGATTCVEMAARGERCGQWGRCPVSFQVAGTPLVRSRTR